MTARPHIGVREVLKFGEPAHGASCFCTICRRKKAFEAPSELADLFVKGEIVLFAGAGISTEVPSVLTDSFYAVIEHAINDGITGRPFPVLMEAFAKTPAGRVGLLERLRERFDYIYSHREIYEEATRFHRELATFPLVDIIVTTNWDTYFEDECGATPFVEDKDVAFWNAASRKVLKIHGTISNLGSIVATQTDYRRCARRLARSILGGHLKSLLATRSTVFVGYSLRDDDFLQVYRAIRRSLADYHRQAYFVAPNVSADDRKRLAGLGLHVVETDGQFLISQMKDYAVARSCLCKDEMYDAVGYLLTEVSDAHDWLHRTYDEISHPQVLITSWYQDGMMHALERILRLKNRGVQSDLHRLQRAFSSYDHFSRRYRADKSYGDAAYCAGYAHAYLFATQFRGDNQPTMPPLFYYFGYEGRSRSHYKKVMRSLPKLHRGAYGFARKILSKYPKNAGLVLHHPVKLNLGRYLSD